MDSRDHDEHGRAHKPTAPKANDNPKDDNSKNTICSLQWIAWAMEAAREHYEQAARARASCTSQVAPARGEQSPMVDPGVASR
jgi:hypothetical protein